ncbi:MAG: single-stranded DNA-binding protein [Clostridiaceae bacterium]|nr:single-stranded DNA-binding protein [Clostridiaceae bacterium]
MYNKVILIGRLTRDPELRASENGNRVSFSLAVDREYKIEGQPDADFFDVVAFKKTADFINEWFNKGMLVLVEGRLQTRKWKDRDNNSRTAVEINADKVRFAESKREEKNALPDDQLPE